MKLLLKVEKQYLPGTDGHGYTFYLIDANGEVVPTEDKSACETLARAANRDHLFDELVACLGEFLAGYPAPEAIKQARALLAKLESL